MRDLHVAYNSFGSAEAGVDTAEDEDVPAPIRDRVIVKVRIPDGLTLSFERDGFES